MRSEAWLNGWSGFVECDHDSDANPYDIQKQRYSYLEWSDGWCAARDYFEKHGRVGVEPPEELKGD